MLKIFGISALLLLSIYFVAVPPVQSLTVWPQPASSKPNGQLYQLVDGERNFEFKSIGAVSDTLDEAFERYNGIIFRRNIVLQKTRLKKITTSSIVLDEASIITGVDVNVLSKDMSLTLETDQSYTLLIEAPRVQITAPTVYGAIYGMESFSQLISRDGFVNGTTINDNPRFQFRSSMIDTARHWLPLETIFAHLDAMAYNKMNVLHWHIVDSQSFPYCSYTYPTLCEEGAYTQTHVYHREDIQSVINYATNRGIRVIPEFDTPGHVKEGLNTIKNLLTPCYDTKTGEPNGMTGPLNPTLDSTYQFLTNFYAEIKDVFSDKFVHVGGDEVSFTCWQSNPQITKFMNAHPNITTYAELESYYEVQLLEILKKQNTSYIIWQEIFDNGVDILPDTVVDVWKSGDWQDEMGRVTSAGFHSVLSAPFYLNYISYGLDWTKYYSVEPTNFTCPAESGSSCDKSLVGGVEQCMWAEFVDATNFLPRVWPRASAVAERGWSQEDVRDLVAAQARIEEFRCKLIERGIPAEPIGNGGSGGTNSFCDQEWQPTYHTPWN
jgi:hexosaminidase